LPTLRGGILLALFACSTICSAHLLGALLDSAARKTVTSIGLFGSTARSTKLATPPCIRFGIRHQNRAERGTLVRNTWSAEERCVKVLTRTSTSKKMRKVLTIKYVHTRAHFLTIHVQGK